MAARRRTASDDRDVGAAHRLIRGVPELSVIPDDLCRETAARGDWTEISEGYLGAEVAGRPSVVERGVLAVIGRDGRPQDLLGPGRLRAPNATQFLRPLVPARLLSLPVDVLDVLGSSVPSRLGPAPWGASLERSGTGPRLVVDAEMSAGEVGRRLDAIGGRVAAVTGMEVPAALHRDTAWAAGSRRVREIATTGPAIDVEAPVIEVLTSLLTAGVPVAPLVSAEVPIGGVGVDDLPLPVGPATRAACLRADRPSGAVAELAARGRAIAVELLDAGAEASAIARVLSSVTVQVVHDTVEGVVAELGTPPARFAWLGFGSLARDEVLPDSDLDTGIAWDHDAGPGAEVWFAELATRATERLRALAYRIDPNGVSAHEPAWRMDLAGWNSAVRTWTDPTRRAELIGVGIGLDVRRVAGDLPADEWLRTTIGEQLGHSAAMASLAADAVRHPAPRLLSRRTGWRSAPLRRTLDLKRDLGAPLVDLARIHTLSRGGGELSTLERLAAAATEGWLDPRLAVALRDGFDLVMRSRLARAVDRAPPVPPAALGPALAPAIRALATAQRQLRVRHGVARR